MAKSYFILLFLVLISITSCNTSRYIFDPPSRQRQDKLKKEWVEVNSFNSGLNIVSAIFAFTFNFVPAIYINQSNLRMYRLKNPEKDTVFVNLLSDFKWDDSTYLDFRDIRIPPDKKCRIILPKQANYNLYFGHTENPAEDFKMEIHPGSKQKILLKKPTENQSNK